MSIKAANLAKEVVRATTDLAIMVKKKQLEKFLAKQTTNKKCFNYGKKSHYTKNCHILNKKKPENSLEKAKHAKWKKNKAKAIAARLIINHNKFDAKPYLVSQVFMTCIDEKQLGVW